MVRVCRGCGEPERNWRDDRGREQVNLEPTSGLCVNCLTRRSSDRRAGRSWHPQPPAFDARAAAARNDD